MGDQKKADKTYQEGLQSDEGNPSETEEKRANQSEKSLDESEDLGEINKLLDDRRSSGPEDDAQ